MLTTIRNVMRTPELRNKILFTLAMIAIYRLGAQIPAPGVSLDALENLRDQANSGPGSVFSYLNLLSGGGLASLSWFALGILPYITASIIIQILTVAIPKLEEWQAQGAVGQRKISQWTRYITIVLALIQSTGIVFLVNRNPEGFFGTDIGLFPNGSAGRILLAVTCITVGSTVVMWMGELITEKGIGNGMSILIFASVVSSLPDCPSRSTLKKVYSGWSSHSSCSSFSAPESSLWNRVSVGFQCTSPNARPVAR